MHILVVAPQPFFQERGTPMAVRLLVETLCADGHDVDLLVYHAGSDIVVTRLRLFRAARFPGIRDVPIGISWQKLVCDVALIASMARRVWQQRYDVIHAVEEAVFPAALLTLLTRQRLVYDMDSSLADQLTDKWRALRPLRRLLVGFERAAVARASVVLAVCEDLAAKVRPWKDPGRVIVLPDVPMGDAATTEVDESLAERAGVGSTIALYVGNLERYQGIDLLVDAAARLRDDVPLHIFVIGGNAAAVDSYRRRAQQLGVALRLHFLGARPVARLNAYLRQADILLSPRTLGQNTPMKVYSYMQSGKPILATDIRSHTQALDAGCALLVAAEPAAFADGMLRLASDPTLRAQLGEAARGKADREYSLPVYQRKLRQAYQLLAQG